jgi:hypothetical protein
VCYTCTVLHYQEAGEVECTMFGRECTVLHCTHVTVLHCTMG